MSLWEIPREGGGRREGGWGRGGRGQVVWHVPKFRYSAYCAWF